MGETSINAYYGEGASKHFSRRIWFDGFMIAILTICGVGLIYVLASNLKENLNNIQRVMCILTYSVSFCYALWLVYDIVSIRQIIKKLNNKERVDVSYNLYNQIRYNKQHKTYITCFIAAVLFAMVVIAALLTAYLSYNPTLYFLFYFTPAIVLIIAPINVGVNILSQNVEIIVDELQFIPEQTDTLNVRKVVSNILDSNSYLISDNSSCILVDAGATLESVQNLTDKIDAILLTHCHYDHIYHLEQIVKAYKVKRIYLSAQGVKKLSDSILNVADTSQMDFVIKAKLPLATIKEDCSFKIGKIDVVALLTPGHSDCGVSYLIGSNLYSGDTLFRRGVGRYDLVTADKAALIGSLQKLQALDFVSLYPGHGEASNYEEQRRNLETWIKFLSRK